MSLFKLAAIVGAAMTTAIAAHAADTPINLVPYSDSDIQTNLIAQFPVGTFKPKNGFGTDFQIAKANQSKTPQVNNFWDNRVALPGHPLGPLVIKTAIKNPKAVYTLINAYAPASGSTIGTIEFKGSKGARHVVQLIAGYNVRDFCLNYYANTINGGTARLAYEIQNVRGSCGTSDVNTGRIATYHIDEQVFKLPAAFQTQTLTQILVTPTNNGHPIVLGITVRH